MSIRIRDLTIHEGLSIVKLDGFEPEPDIAVDPETGEEWDATAIDPPGSANWLCEQYGMSGDDYAGPGILRSDYDGWKGGPRDFTLLVTSDEAEALATFAREAGYYVSSIEAIAEPTNFGDSHEGTVEILKHRDGWVILEN